MRSHSPVELILLILLFGCLLTYCLALLKHRTKRATPSALTLQHHEDVTRAIVADDILIGELAQQELSRMALELGISRPGNGRVSPEGRQ